MFAQHTIKRKNGSSIANNDGLVLYNNTLTNASSYGSIASVAVTTPGSYAPAVTPTVTTSGPGSGATLTAAMGVLTAAVGTAQSGSGSYAPNDTVTCTGGTATTNAIFTVNTTLVQSATIAAAGTGGTNGAATVTGTTGTGTKFQASVTISGGSITAVNSIAIAGSYTVNPTSLTNEPVTGAGLSGAQLSVKMGIATATPTTVGVYSVTPATLTQGSTSGTGTGATFTVSAYKVVSVSGSGGTLYDSTSQVVFSSGSAAATITLSNTNNPSVLAVAVTNLPAVFQTFVNMGQAGTWYVAQSSKTSTGFNITLNPPSGGAIVPGSVDVLVLA